VQSIIRFIKTPKIREILENEEEEEQNSVHDDSPAVEERAQHGRADGDETDQGAAPQANNNSDISDNGEENQNENGEPQGERRLHDRVEMIRAQRALALDDNSEIGEAERQDRYTINLRAPPDPPWWGGGEAVSLSSRYK
jgi:hypothetical protein